MCPTHVDGCVCLSSDGARGGGSGEALLPFSSLPGVGVPLPHPIVVSSAVGRGWEGTLTLLTALAAGQGSGTGLAFSPGWWVGQLTAQPLVTVFSIVSIHHNFLFHVLFYKKFRNIFAWIIVNRRFISTVCNIVCLLISTLNWRALNPPLCVCVSVSVCAAVIYPRHTMSTSTLCWLFSLFSGWLVMF